MKVLDIVDRYPLQIQKNTCIIGVSTAFVQNTFSFLLTGSPLKLTKFAMYSEEQDSHGLLTLHYGKHHATIVDEIKTCFTSENFADMTFICDDKTSLSAHKLIMASASPLVRRILGESVHAHGPSVVLIPGIKSCHLRHLLDFLYNGQACVKVYL